MFISKRLTDAILSQLQQQVRAADRTLKGVRRFLAHQLAGASYTPDDAGFYVWLIQHNENDNISTADPHGLRRSLTNYIYVQRDDREYGNVDFITSFSGTYKYSHTIWRLMEVIR